MTAVADQPVRAAVREDGASPAAARPGPAPKTTPISLRSATALDRTAARNRTSLVPGIGWNRTSLIPGAAPRRASLVPGAAARLTSPVPGAAWNRTGPGPVPARTAGWGWATGRGGRSWTTAGAPAVHRPAGRTTVVRDKLREWGRRYLLAEIA